MSKKKDKIKFKKGKITPDERVVLDEILNETTTFDTSIFPKDEDLYKIGQKLWCFHHDNKGKLSKGKLVHKFELDGRLLYILEFETGIEPVYECRDWSTVSEDGKALNFWKVARAMGKQAKATL